MCALGPPRPVWASSGRARFRLPAISVDTRPPFRSHPLLTRPFDSRYYCFRPKCAPPARLPALGTSAADIRICALARRPPRPFRFVPLPHAPFVTASAPPALRLPALGTSAAHIKICAPARRPPPPFRFVPVIMRSFVTASVSPAFCPAPVDIRPFPGFPRCYCFRTPALPAPAPAPPLRPQDLGSRLSTATLCCMYLLVGWRRYHSRHVIPPAPASGISAPDATSTCTVAHNKIKLMRTADPLSYDIGARPGPRDLAPVRRHRRPFSLHLPIQVYQNSTPLLLLQLQFLGPHPFACFCAGPFDI
ncbi:hypothetical protein DFH06DRAFT_1317332 [Mycena polygramma]|nr:hypothetical protein DFH06DRAFT_1317332 [Mycena polygramma]